VPSGSTLKGYGTKASGIAFTILIMGGHDKAVSPEVSGALIEEISGILRKAGREAYQIKGSEGVCSVINVSGANGHDPAALKWLFLPIVYGDAGLLERSRAAAVGKSNNTEWTEVSEGWREEAEVSQELISRNPVLTHFSERGGLDIAAEDRARHLASLEKMRSVYPPAVAGPAAKKILAS